MDFAAENNYPQLCFEVGLNCQGCTAESARQLARVVKGLRGKMIGQMFVQIYPHPACAPMHAHFADCYRASASALEGEPLAMAAVA